jgi:hypothetical protein
LQTTRKVSFTKNKIPKNKESAKRLILQHIQLNVNALNKYYKKAAENIPAGHSCTVDSIMEGAMEKYQQDNKNQFQIFSCIPILHIIPKFDPMVITIIDDNQPEQPSVMGCSLQRPIGNKAAKLMKKMKIPKLTT